MFSDYLKDAYFWFIDNLNNIATAIALVISILGFWLRLIDRRTKVKVETKDDWLDFDKSHQEPLERVLTTKITNQTMGRNLVIETVGIEWGVLKWPTWFWSKVVCPIFDYDETKPEEYIEDVPLPDGGKPYEFFTLVDQLEGWLHGQCRERSGRWHFRGRDVDDYDFVTFQEALRYWGHDLFWHKSWAKSFWARIVIRDSQDNWHRSRNKFQIRNLWALKRYRMQKFSFCVYFQYAFRNFLNRLKK